MRSNYGEILPFLALMKQLGISEVAFQTMLIDARNLTREPGLVNEVIKDPEEVRELYSIVLQAMEEEGPNFRRISWSGLHSLFKQHGLDAAFLDEENSSLYPDQPSNPHQGQPRGQQSDYRRRKKGLLSPIVFRIVLGWQNRFLSQLSRKSTGRPMEKLSCVQTRGRSCSWQRTAMF